MKYIILLTIISISQEKKYLSIYQIINDFYKKFKNKCLKLIIINYNDIFHKSFLYNFLKYILYTIYIF